MRKIVVIGSGFGGLAIAVRLQARGFEVTILEKNAKIGGRAYQLIDSGYTFDMGPSLITAPDLMERVFQSAALQMSDYLELIKLDPFYRIYFHDGTHLDYTGHSDTMKQQMAKFSAHDAENYESFIAHSKRIYDAVITEGLGTTPFMGWGTMLRFIPRAARMGAIIPAYKFVKRYFEHPHHRFAFSFHPLFIGGNPFRAPAIYLMIPYLEKAGGVWFTQGGMYSVVKAFGAAFEKLGGIVETNAEVQQITIRNGRAIGIQTEHGSLDADAVVSNADVAHTYRDLIPSEHRRKWTDRRIESKAYSMSALLLYIGVRRQYPELHHHTLILSPRYEGLIRDIFDRKLLADDFSMYLHVPTRSDPSMAPEGCESMYVLVPVPNLSADIDWQRQKQSYAARILNFLEHDFGLENLQQEIEVLHIFTPEDFQRKQNAYLGSAWGMEPKLTQTAYFRPHNRSEDIEHLYFVGAGTHPGAGVPGVLLAAEATERLIAEDLSPV